MKPCERFSRERLLRLRSLLNTKYGNTLTEDERIACTGRTIPVIPPIDAMVIDDAAARLGITEAEVQNG